MRLNPIIAGMLVGAVTLGVVLAASAAQARVFVGVGIGIPGPVYYPPPVVYAPPPAVVYAPPPAVYATPPTAYVAPAAPPASAQAPVAQDCREYRSPTTIDGRPQETIGTACRQPDGSWRIVN